MISLPHVTLKPNDYSNPNYIGSKFRKRRFMFFESKLNNIQRPVNILDIGGTVRFWIDENYHQKDVTITVLNTLKEESPYENIKTSVGDACDLFEFKSKSFDIAFSNSLIEHLYNKENQIKMANEAMRVAKYFFVQTPNRYFPIEPHFKFPFFQFLSRSTKIFLQTHTKLINGVKYARPYAENIVDEIKLLSKNEMMELFPMCDLYVENFLGFPKSFIAHNMRA